MQYLERATRRVANYLAERIFTTPLPNYHPYPELADRSLERFFIRIDNRIDNPTAFTPASELPQLFYQAVQIMPGQTRRVDSAIRLRGMIEYIPQLDAHVHGLGYQYFVDFDRLHTFSAILWSHGNWRSKSRRNEYDYYPRWEEIVADARAALGTHPCVEFIRDPIPAVQWAEIKKRRITELFGDDIWKTKATRAREEEESSETTVNDSKEPGIRIRNRIGEMGLILGEEVVDGEVQVLINVGGIKSRIRKQDFDKRYELISDSEE